MADMGTRGPKEIDPLDISSWLPGRPKFPITGDGTPEGDKQALAYGMMPVPEVGFYQGMGGLKSIGDGIARAQAISYNRDMLAKVQSNQQNRFNAENDAWKKYSAAPPQAQGASGTSTPSNMGAAPPPAPSTPEPVAQPQYASAPDSRPAIAGGSDGVVPSAPGMGLSSPPPAMAMMRPPMVDQADVDMAPPMQVGGNMGNVAPADVPVRAPMPVPAPPIAPAAPPAPAAQSADDVVPPFPQPMHLDGRPNGTQTAPVGGGGVPVPASAASWFNKPQPSQATPAPQPATPQVDPRLNMIASEKARLAPLFQNPGTRQFAIQRLEQLEKLEYDLNDPSRQGQIALQKLQMEKAGIDIKTAQRELDAPKDVIKAVKEGESLIKFNPRTGQYEKIYGGAGADGDSEQSKEFRKEAAKQSAKIFEGHADDGNKAVATLNDIDRLQQLSDVVGSGKIAAMMPTVGPWLQSIGLNPQGLQEAQMFTAIINKLAPALRQAGSGAMSDRDLEIFMSSLPQLSQTKEGRDGIMKQLRSIGEYSVQKGRYAQAALTGKMSPQKAEEEIQKLQDGLKSQMAPPANSLREKLRSMPDGSPVDGAMIGQPGKRFVKHGAELHEVVAAPPVAAPKTMMGAADNGISYQD